MNPKGPILGLKPSALLILVAFLMVPALIFAGGEKETESLTLRILAANSIKPMPDSSLVDAWNRAEEKYEKAHPNVKLEYEMMPVSEIFTKFVLLVEQGDPPDIVHLPDAVMYPYAQAGFLEDLTPYMSNRELNDFTDFANSLRYDDKVYCIPVSTDVRVLVYNKALFRNAGLDEDTPPEHWEDVITMGKKLNHVEGEDQYAYGIIAGPNFHTPLMWMPLVWQCGGSLIGEGGKADFTNDAVFRAAGHYYDLIYKHEIMPKTVLGMDEDAIERTFLAGQLAMAVMGNWKFTSLIEKGFNEDDLGWGPLPYPKDGEPATLGGSWNWAVSADTAHPEAAYEFIAAMNTDEFLIEEAQAAFRVPVRKSHANSARFASDPRHKAMIEYSVESGRFGLDTPNPIGFATALITALQMYWGGAASAEEAFSAQEAEYNKTLQ